MKLNQRRLPFDILGATVLSGLLIIGCGGGGTSPTTQNITRELAYVGLFGDNAVAVVDLAEAKTTTTIAVTAPDGMALTPDGKKLYVSSSSTGALAVIDTTTEQIVSMVPVGTQPQGLAITPDGKWVVAAVQGDGQAVLVDTATDTVAARANVGKAHSSATSPDGTVAFVASQVTGAPALQVVNLPGGTVGATFALAAPPRALCDLGGKLYTTMSGSADIQVLDATSGQSLGSIATAGSPHDIRPTIDGTKILTVSQTAGELEVIDPATSTIASRVATGAQPHWIALSRDTIHAYVTNEGDNALVVVDLATSSVTQTIAVGAAPRKIVVKP